MYEIDVLKFTVKRDKTEKVFTIEDYNFQHEELLNDYMKFMCEEVVVNLTIVIYHNKIVKYLKIDLNDYSVKRG